ncbi:hypothetical protein IAU60_006887 [Kwoniella sp. DSM 27419]
MPNPDLFGTADAHPGTSLDQAQSYSSLHPGTETAVLSAIPGNSALNSLNELFPQIAPQPVIQSSTGFVPAAQTYTGSSSAVDPLRNVDIHDGLLGLERLFASYSSAISLPFQAGSTVPASGNADVSSYDMEHNRLTGEAAPAQADSTNGPHDHRMEDHTDSFGDVLAHHDEPEMAGHQEIPPASKSPSVGEGFIGSFNATHTPSSNVPVTVTEAQKSVAVLRRVAEALVEMADAMENQEVHGQPDPPILRYDAREIREIIQTVLFSEVGVEPQT